MRQLGFENDIIDSIKALYHQDNFYCEVGDIKTRKIYPRRGLKQGCVLSPSLFNIYIMDLESRLNALKLGLVVSQDCNISTLLFADDVLIITESEENMQRLLTELHDWCSDYRMSISDTKSKVLSPHDLGFWEVFDIHMDYVTSLEQVDQCKYLGVEIMPSIAGIKLTKNKQIVSRAWSFAKSIMSNLKYDLDRTDVILASWKNVALPAILYGIETIMFFINSMYLLS